KGNGVETPFYKGGTEWKLRSTNQKMSTKQYVLYTLMIFFLVLTMITGILWFQSALELDSKLKQIAALKDDEVRLNIVLEGTGSNPMLGVMHQFDDPQKGVEFLLKE